MSMVGWVNDDVLELLELQSGVVSRRQLLSSGLAAHDVRRLVRRRELVRIHHGVYLDHTGQPTWLQRAWAAVLAVWPAALCHESAIRAAVGPGRTGKNEQSIHVAVSLGRHLRAPNGVRMHRLADLEPKTRWNLSPPRLRIEEALVDVAAEADDEFGAIAVLADAIQPRRTTARRLRGALDDRSRIARRDFLCGLLNDLDRGTGSVLEHGYLTRVERPHGLPCAIRQAVGEEGRFYRDAHYRDYGLVVELDGRAFHDSASARDRDLDRDLAAAVEGSVTVRLGWGQVFKRPCVTAEQLAALLIRRGWDGAMLPCPDCPPT